MRRKATFTLFQRSLQSGSSQPPKTLEQPRLRLRAQSSIKRAERTGGYAAFASHFSSISLNFGGCILQKHHLLALSMGLEAPDEVNSPVRAQRDQKCSFLLT